MTAQERLKEIINDFAYATEFIKKVNAVSGKKFNRQWLNFYLNKDKTIVDIEFKKAIETLGYSYIWYAEGIGAKRINKGDSILKAMQDVQMMSDIELKENLNNIEKLYNYAKKRMELKNYVNTNY